MGMTEKTTIKNATVKLWDDAFLRPPTEEAAMERRITNKELYDPTNIRNDRWLDRLTPSDLIGLVDHKIITIDEARAALGLESHGA